MKLSTFRVAAAMLMLFAFASQSSAGLLTSAHIIPTTYTQSNNASPKAKTIVDYLELSTVSPYETVTDVGDLLYKWEQGGSEDASASLVDSYDIVDQLNQGRDGATLRYASAGDIVNTLVPAWLVVKGGSSGFVVYDLDSFGPVGLGWNGSDDLTFTNAGLFGPQGQLQAISHIQVWGGTTAPPVDPGPEPAPGSVPEPTTMAIWSVIGLCGLGSARRKRKNNA